MNQKTYIVIGVVAVALLLIGYGFVKTTPLGGSVHNVIEIFSNGLIIGTPTKAACLKVQDTDESGFTYITYLNGVQVITGGSSNLLASGAQDVPTDCLDLVTIGGK